jgi:hypothetical protein
LVGAARQKPEGVMGFEDLLKHRVSIQVMYSQIAHEQAARYHELSAEFQRLEFGPAAEEELSEISRRAEECYNEREKSAVIAVTFAGMALEAFFYDYAADKLGDTFVKEHLDKLDLKSRYLIYPQLVCGKAPDKSRSAYASLGRLVALRNELVHFKSRSFPIEELHRASDFHDALNEKLRAGVDDAIRCIKEVMTELDQLHGSGTAFVARLQGSPGKPLIAERSPSGNTP